MTFIVIAVRSMPSNGGVGTVQPWSKTMNFLNVIRDSQVKRNRLSDAQFLMAKAYRGIDYSKVEARNPTGNYQLMYRGSKHIASR